MEITQKTEHKDGKKKVNLRYQRDKDREMVKGIFRFYEVPGGEMRFSYRAYKEDPIENYSLVDGQVYTLPLGVAKHLNKNLWYPEYGYIKGEDMKNVQHVTRKVRRAGFQSLEFIDMEDLSENGGQLLEVTSQSPII